ncbi:ATP-dependent helicase [Salipiger mucosus]|uniref:DNA 3'-5' helicase n=1 Tax=Salipiger mucosus DSM 16094 TaxID=1123237 RepID=S9QWK5_9RHOB|nr:ATP-dependent helicase [Salipiger mucosus]EPX83993.1 Superfamily I DNA and RNA helicase [Salipiger mucosus DSM 16094]
MPATRAQLAAARSKGHTLVLAGPGTGKTTTLIERCRTLVRAGVPLDAMFVSTFTAKAATEIRERLKASLATTTDGVVDKDEILKNAHIGTFHSLCARLLKRFPTDVGLPYDFEIIGDEDQRQLLYDLEIQWDEEDGNYVDMISRWKDRARTPEQAMEEARELGDKFTVGAAKAYARYEEARRETAAVDFSDLITLSTQILKSGGKGQKWFHGNFSHFVIDEFQDTNRTQIDFLRAALGPYGQIWAVGDENQSLYEWRGSSPSYCLNFGKIFPGATIHELNEGFRCSPQIVKMSSRVISRNRSRYDKAMKPARKSRKGEFVLFKGFLTHDAEADWIAKQLAKFQANGGKLENAAVLFRTATVANTLQRRLERERVPFRLTGTGSFWSLPEVSLYVTAVASVAGDKRFDTRKGFGRTKAGFKCRSLAEELHGETARVISEPLARVLYEHRPRSLDQERRSSWMASVEAVSNLLLDFDDLGGFLDYVTQRTEEEGKRDGDCVTLSTLHSAKGLEWDMVFVAGCESELLPHFKSTNVEEERRLFYVGMTRARHQLLMTYARLRNDKDKKPSPFLQEAKLPEGENPGVFKWSDPENGKGRDHEEAPDKKSGSSSRKDESTSATRRRKSYRNRGGRSLIPPEEYGKG